MTVLILAQRKILLPLRISLRWEELMGIFSRVNKNGTITIVSTTLIIFSVISYLLAAYFIFGLGFVLQEKNKEVSRYEAAAARKELKLHEAKNSLLRGGSVLLNSMEKVTSIKYLVPQGFAASNIGGQP